MSQEYLQKIETEISIEGALPFLQHQIIANTSVEVFSSHFNPPTWRGAEKQNQT